MYFLDENKQIFFLEREDEELISKFKLKKMSQEELQALNPSEEELLNEAKNLKIKEINDKKERVLNQGHEYKGKLYQSANEDLIRINGAITNALINSDTISSIEWIAFDNTITKFSVNEFKNFASSMALFVQETIFKARALKQRVKNAQNKDELQFIKWEGEIE